MILQVVTDPEAPPVRPQRQSRIDDNIHLELVAVIALNLNDARIPWKRFADCERRNLWQVVLAVSPFKQKTAQEADVRIDDRHRLLATSALADQFAARHMTELPARLLARQQNLHGTPSTSASTPCAQALPTPRDSTRRPTARWTGRSRPSARPYRRPRADRRSRSRRSWCRRSDPHDRGPRSHRGRPAGTPFCRWPPTPGSVAPQVVRTPALRLHPPHLTGGSGSARKTGRPV